MDEELLGKGLRLIEQASSILESISNDPGVTPEEFYEALDIQGIICTTLRQTLFQAAISVEQSLDLITEESRLTVH
jgi:hypothetical protein